MDEKFVYLATISKYCTNMTKYGIIKVAFVNAYVEKFQKIF